MNKIPKTKKTTSAAPPIPPPTIAPRLLDWGIAELLLGAAGVDVDATVEVLKVVAADWLLIFVVGGGWEVLDGELVDPPVPVVAVVDDVEAVIVGVGDLEVTGVDVAVVVVMSENVWAATLFCEVKVTPTGSSTPDPSAAFARFAWQATGKVVWVGSSLDITYPYSPEGSTENALPEEMPDKSAQILRNRVLVRDWHT
jgi:hypothetical protein